VLVNNMLTTTEGRGEKEDSTTKKRWSCVKSVGQVKRERGVRPAVGKRAHRQRREEKAVVWPTEKKKGGIDGGKRVCTMREKEIGPRNGLN